MYLISIMMTGQPPIEGTQGMIIMMITMMMMMPSYRKLILPMYPETLEVMAFNFVHPVVTILSLLFLFQMRRIWMIVKRKMEKK